MVYEIDLLYAILTQGSFSFSIFRKPFRNYVDIVSKKKL